MNAATLKNRLGLDKATKTECMYFIGICAVFVGFICLQTSMHRTLFYVALIPALFLPLKSWKSLNINTLKPLLTLTAILCSYNVISAFWNESMDAQTILDATKTPIFIIVFIASFAVFFARHRRALKPFEVIFVWSLAAFCILYGAKYIMQNGFDLSQIGGNMRLNGWGRASNSNVLGKVIACALIIGAFGSNGLIGSLTSRSAIYKILPLIILGCALLLTGARAATLAVLIAGFITIILSKDRNLIILAALSLTIGALALATYSDVIQNWAMRADTYRIELWSAGAELIRERPIFGHGAGAEFKMKTYDAAPRLTSVHNIYIGTWIYGGIVNAALFVIATFLLIYHAYKSSKIGNNYAPIALTLCGVVLFQFSGHTAFVNLNPEWFFIWLPMAYTIMLCQGDTHEDSNIKR